MSASPADRCTNRDRSAQPGSPSRTRCQDDIVRPLTPHCGLSPTVAAMCAAAAATEWDRLTRPHLAAYCRWRAAQVAGSAGQASIASRLLRRAARESRTHRPLNAAVMSASADAY